MIMIRLSSDNEIFVGLMNEETGDVFYFDRLAEEASHGWIMLTRIADQKGLSAGLVIYYPYTKYQFSYSYYASREKMSRT